jgi:hypothetical protein
MQALFDTHPTPADHITGLQVVWPNCLLMVLEVRAGPWVLEQDLGALATVLV